MINYSSQEIRKASVNYRLDDLSIHISKPNTHVGSDHKQSSENNNIDSLSGIIRWDCNP